MDPHSRQLALDQLATSEAQLVALFDNLTPAQWHFRESPDRWSIAENLEHLIAFEAFIRAAIQNALEAPPEPEKKSQAAAKNHLVFGLANTRATKLSAREAVRPIGRCSSNPTAMIDELRHTRAQTIAFVAGTQAALHDHFFPHIAFGDIDCYQWIIVLAQHTARHAGQILQVKADSAFPPSERSPATP